MTATGVAYILGGIAAVAVLGSLALVDRRNQRRWRATMSAFDDLVKQVQANTDAEAAAVQAIQGIATQLQAAQGDPQKIAALTAQLKSSADALGAAIVANTTPAPTAPAAPTPDQPPTTTPDAGATQAKRR